MLVAYYIIEFGGEVDAIIDTSSKFDWIKSTLSLISNPKNFKDGIKWLAKILFNKVPIYSNSMIAKATQYNEYIQVKIQNINTGKQESLVTGTLAVGHGLIPSTDITRLLGAKHIYNESKGGWIAKIDDYLRSSLDGIYVTGDGAGISGAIAAKDKGLLASLALLYDEKIIKEKEFKIKTKKIVKRLNKYELFAKAIAKLNSTPPQLLNNIKEETILCRCEDITKKDILKAIDNGAKDLNQLKSWTRFGMGPCQGRTCQYSVAKVVAEELKRKVGDIGYLTGRSPIRPVPLDRAIGEFDYNEITKIEAAPL
tara:strand:- start:128 stop:1060 length:933 start_codon:yes stop_codon:yes gene_type:complete